MLLSVTVLLMITFIRGMVTVGGLEYAWKLR